jgi:hypothetical protein
MREAASRHDPEHMRNDLRFQAGNRGGSRGPVHVPSLPYPSPSRPAAHGPQAKDSPGYQRLLTRTRPRMPAGMSPLVGGIPHHRPSQLGVRATQQREPRTGANAIRHPRTYTDPARRFGLVRGRTSDFVRPTQTPRPCLGVKGRQRHRGKAISAHQDVLTDSLTRPAKTGETQRKLGDSRRARAQVSETHRNRGDYEDARRGAHNPATAGPHDTAP